MTKIGIYNQTDRANEMIVELIKIHEVLREQVDFNRRDKKLAVWLLLGGMLTSLVRCMHFARRGELEKILELQRIIPEAMDLTIFFCESPGSRQINQWFNGKIVERKSGNKGNLTIEERAQFLNTKVRTIENMDDMVKTANELLSRYFHPAYEFITLAYDSNNQVFKYYSQHRLDFSEDEIKSMLKLIVHPVLVAFSVSLNAVFPTDGALDYLKTMAGFTRELYPEAFLNLKK